ncbi:MAG TPA: M1 family metallopeptidase [Candidatus Saccharimonadales bacterium]|nr:M1 family metallopeptidase [Candidatus Saccharimonadales bacterium]
MSSSRNHRLPTHVKPERYRIMLRPDLEEFTFTGEETIYLTLEKSTKKIILHAAELAISHVSMQEGSAKPVIGKVSYNIKNETVTLTFPKALSVGKKELTLHFSGILNDKMRGFYRSRYEVKGVVTHMAVSQFESTDARRAFPCIDEPAAKAVFDVTLQIPSHTTAISNSLEEEIKEHEAGIKVVKFMQTPKMSTYLLAFIVGQFEFIEKKTKEGVLVRVFTTAGKKHQAEFALDTAVKLLEFYNDYFDIDYPLPVLDLIAIPDFAAGAMENWGAVTFREATLLVDPQHTSLISKQWVALVIAHELAHMWFGNLATMEWWTHLWLNEGFATYIEHVAIDKLFPQWEIWKQFIATEHNEALTLDGLKNTHPIEVEVHHPSEISEIFDQVSYAKGSSILCMLATYLGPADFRDGLREYLKTFAYKNAQTQDLWSAFEKVSKKPVGKIMKHWTAKPGHPVVRVSQKGESLELSQHRFFSSPLSHQKDPTLWSIPLPVKFESKQNVYLFSERDFVLPAPSRAEWVKLNSGETSFVRVHYSHELLSRLEVAVTKGELRSVDRLGLIRDAFDLSAAGQADVSDALTLSKSYRQETEYVVWFELLSQLATVENLIADDAKLNSRYKNFVKDLVSEIAQKVGWEKALHEDHSDTLLRGLILYVYGKCGDGATIKTAHRLFESFIKNKKNIDPDIRSVVYTLVARGGDEKTFDLLVKLHETETLHQEKDRIARALCGFTDPKLLARTLEWSISSDVRPQDTPRIMYALFANPKSRDITWEFLKQHWEDFDKQFSGSHGFARIIEGAKEFTKSQAADDIEAFFKIHKTPELERTLKQVTEQIRANAAFKRRAKPQITAFLKSQ